MNTTGIVTRIIFILFLAFGLISVASIFSLIRVLINIKKYNELEKKAVYESMAISFLIVMGIHLTQLILIIFFSDPYAELVALFISPGDVAGGFNTNYPVIHFDSFTIDFIILGSVYFFKNIRPSLKKNKKKFT